MKKQIQDLQQRELLLLFVAGIFVIITIIYVFIWKPLSQENQLIQIKIKQYEWSLVELKYLKGLSNSAEVIEMPSIKTDQPLVVIIDIVLRKYDLYENLQRSQPIGDNTIRLSLIHI